MRITISAVGLLLLTAGACKVNKNLSNSKEEKIILEDVVIKPRKVAKTPTLQVMEPLGIKLQHTTLYLQFNYQKQWVEGKAVLSLKSSSRPDSLHLDARGFALHKIASIKGKDTIDLNYNYDGAKIGLRFGPSDSLKLLVAYTAKPLELPNEGGRAITDSRGLYFINPSGTDPNKPRQIWTQGETEYNSCWFPTLDAPNQKHTQDILVETDSGEVSLSNGVLLDRKPLGKGRHIDHWQQLKPHAPYLTMLAIGNFVITKDSWRGKEVSYYLEPAYAPYARTIFGKTPEMIEVFSTLTGVPYPWDKYSQVVCRDYVSGAMENTSAVVHGEFVQHDDREHLDNPQEDIIAHELFHHWFGDYVTCRSWGHLPLNESFATYGEYLYKEAVMGKEEADRAFSNNFDAYLRQKQKHQVAPIRQYFADPDEMFDVVSYQKGSWILHHLRSVVGDSNFFKGLKYYLTDNAFGTADIHLLRLAMEKASGVDLLPFFNRWFLSKGHPEFAIRHYVSANGQLNFEINQIQDSSFGVFEMNLPLQVIFEDGSKQLLSIPVNSLYTLYQLPVSKAVKTWFADPNGTVPAVFKEDKTTQYWLAQLKQAAGWQPTLRATRALYLSGDTNAVAQAAQYLLGQTQWYYNYQGLLLINENPAFNSLEGKVKQLAMQGYSARLARLAMQVLAERYSNTSKHHDVYFANLREASYGRVATALELLYKDLPDTTLFLAKRYENLPSGSIQRVVAMMYAKTANPGYINYFDANLGKHGVWRRSILSSYNQYVINLPLANYPKAFQVIKNYYQQNSDEGKADYTLSFMENWKQKSTHTSFFDSAEVKQFMEMLSKD